MTINQYGEQGIFIDFVDRSELADKLEQRITEGMTMLESTDAKAMASYLGYFAGNHTTAFWREVISQRINHLMERLEKLKAKES